MVELYFKNLTLIYCRVSKFNIFCANQFSCGLCVDHCISYFFSVAYVSRSGGMSNELNNIISRTTDGVFEGVAIGGDR
jgi:succinyl-CoA synthetase alpha subunit